MPITTDAAPPALPGARELHRLARESRVGEDMTTPAAFVELRRRLDEVEAERTRLVADMHGLVREAYDLGVPMSVVSRWSGYAMRWVQNILGKK